MHPIRCRKTNKPSARISTAVVLLFTFILNLGIAKASAPLTVPPANQKSGCGSKVDWECFNTSVAIVGRFEDGRILDLCSGIAIDPRTVLTAAHCIETLKSQPIEVQIFRQSAVDVQSKPESSVKTDSLYVDRLYSRQRSYFHRDRGIIKLNEDLRPRPGETLNFPKLRGQLDKLIESTNVIHRIGFGARHSRSGANENRRTWVTSKVHSVLPEVLVTSDRYASPGDSGGPLFLFLPGEGLYLIGIHSTFDSLTGLVYNPRIL